MKNKRTKVIGLTIVILSILALFALNASAGAIVSIGNVSVAPNNTTTVPIMIYNVTNLGSGTISVTYNSFVVHVTKVESGNGNALMVQAWSANNTLGKVQIVAWNVISPVSGDVIFANVTYKVVGMGGSSSPLSLKVSDLTDYDTYAQIPYTLNNGNFKVSYNNKSDELENINHTNISEKINSSAINTTKKNIIIKVLDIIKKLFSW